MLYYVESIQVHDLDNELPKRTSLQNLHKYHDKYQKEKLFESHKTNNR